MSNSEEEEIARNYICFGNADCTIIVLDATCLERNLNLVFQTLEITKKVVVCVNLLDEAEKKGVKINLDLLEKKLGVPVCGTIAQKKKTLTNLMATVQKVADGSIITNPKCIHYPELIENSIHKLCSIIESGIPYESKYLSRWISIKLLDDDKKIINSIEKNIFKTSIHNIKDLDNELQLCISNLENSNLEEDKFKDKIVSSILSEANIICKDVCEFTKNKYNNRDRKIDKLLTSKTFGLPIMLLFLGIIFWLTISGANYPSKLLSDLFRFFTGKTYKFC